MYGNSFQKNNNVIPNTVLIPGTRLYRIVSSRTSSPIEIFNFHWFNQMSYNQLLSITRQKNITLQSLVAQLESFPNTVSTGCRLLTVEIIASLPAYLKIVFPEKKLDSPKYFTGGISCIYIPEVTPQKKEDKEQNDNSDKILKTDYFRLVDSNLI